MCPKHNSQFSLFSSFNSILAFPMISIHLSDRQNCFSLQSAIHSDDIPWVSEGVYRTNITTRSQTRSQTRNLSPSKKHRKTNPLIKTFRLKTQNQWKLMKKQANTKQQDSWQCYKQKMKILPLNLILPLNPVNIQMIGQQHLLKIKKSFLPSLPRIGIIVLVMFLHHPSAESLRSLQISILQHANHAY